jgi:Na+-transporting NADH:ubiquinone oxidoreductase subunit A
MISVKVKKGYDLKIAGAPMPELSGLENPTHVALCPERIPFVKPRLKVKKDDAVSIGSLLFEDKRNPDIRFLSPGAGRISEINFGARRIIREIVIRLDGTEDALEFEPFAEEELNSTGRDRLVEALLSRGLWQFFRALPFRDIPSPGTSPPAIWVSIGSLEPFHPSPGVYLRGRESLLRYGVKMLKIIAGGRVMIGAAAADRYVRTEFSDILTHTYSGAYPAHDAGVLVYHTKSAPDWNRCWYIDAQQLLLIAETLKNGVYRTERVVTVAGSMIEKREHVKTRLGAPVSLLIDGRIGTGNSRYLAGGVLTGFVTSADGFLGAETSLTVLPKGDDREMLALFRPGYDKPSFSRTFLSSLNPHPMAMDTDRHGGRRACIACNHCPKVCPVDILPQLTYKAILAGEIEEALAHGLLDCVECGLCSYVCPSKIELYQTLKNAKSDYYKEQART